MGTRGKWRADVIRVTLKCGMLGLLIMWLKAQAQLQILAPLLI